MKKTYFLWILMCFIAGLKLQAGNGQKADASLVVPGKLVVKLKKGMDEQNSFLNKNTVSSKRFSFEIINYEPVFKSFKNSSDMRLRKKSGIDFSQHYILNFDRSQPVSQVMKELRDNADIEYVEPLYMHRISYAPNDPDIASQVYLDEINATQAWDINKSSQDVIVAIIDSGVDYLHEDLMDKIYLNEGEIPDNGIDDDADGYIDNYYGWDFAGSEYTNVVQDKDPLANQENISHGTAVAGCAAAATDNGIGVAGVGFNARYMALKCSAEDDTRDDGSAFLLNVYSAVIYAADHGADVINMSFGGSGYSQFAQDAMTYAAIEKGVVLVAAAGNEGSDLLSYPAAYEHVLSVGATGDRSGKSRADFSNFGYWVDMSAPGVDIYTTMPNNQYGEISGTSFSSPITAGAAALLIGQFPDYNQYQIRQLLIQSATPIDEFNPGFEGQLGKGRLNVEKALTISTPALRIADYSFGNDLDEVPEKGEMAIMTMNVTNDLVTTSGNAVLKVTQLSGTAVILDNSEFSLAALATGQTKSFDPLFTFTVPEESLFNEILGFNFEFTDVDSDYSSNERILVLINPISTPSYDLPYLLVDGGDFESNTSDFVSAQLTGGINLWELGVPENELTEVTSGSSAWKTDLDSDLLKEDYSCVLQTPIFDFSETEKEYLLSFYKSMESEFCNAPSAVQLQYSLDGLKWTRLGQYGDFEGSNWYNKDPLGGCPIAPAIFPDQEGWLGNFSNEYTAYDISFLAGNPEILFRFVLSVSGGFDSPLKDDGFMIDDFQIEVNAPSASFTVDHTSVAVGRSLNFEYKGNGAQTFSWDFGDGVGTSDEENPSYAYSQSGTYSVSLTITSTSGTDVVTKTNYINVLKKYTVPYGLADGGNFELNQSDFVAENTNGTAFELGSSSVEGKDGTASGDFAWVTGLSEDEYQDNSRAVLFSPTFDLSDLSAYTLEFKSKYAFEDNWDGFIVQYSLDLGESWTKLNKSEEGWYNQISDPESIFGESVPIFSGNTSGRFETFSTDITFLGSNADVIFRFLFLTDANTVDAGMALDDFRIAKAELVDAVADFSYQESISDCSGHEVTFTDISTGSISEYSWDFGLGATPAIASGKGPHTVTYSADVLQTSSVTLKVEGILNGEVTETKTDIITTAPTHTPTISEIDNGDDAQFELEASLGDSYQWYFKGNPIDQATDRILTATQTGSFAVEVSVDGCVGVSDVFEVKIITGVNDFSTKISVYPNPSKGTITVEAVSGYLNTVVELRLYDLSGRLVDSEVVRPSKSSHDFSSLRKGTYIMELRGIDFRLTKRIILN